MTARIGRLGIAFILMYAVLFVQLNRVQFVDAEEYREHVGNIRPQLREFGQERGDIVTADGVVAAFSIPVEGGEIDFRRSYPTGDRYAHIVGFQSFNQGAFGLEREYNTELAGQELDQQFESIRDIFVDRDTTGTVVMTLRDDMQKAAAEALGERKGSVVALDPRTGEIIAMWTYPSFDPNVLSGLDGEAVNAAYSALLADPDDPLLAKAYREVFFPGSTFKLVTAAAAIDTADIGLLGPVWPDSSLYEPIPAGADLRNFGGSTCGGNLLEALRVSCNTTFAEIGAEWVGPELMSRTAENFGFNSPVPIDLPNATQSNFPTDYGAYLADVDHYRAPEPDPDTDEPTDGPILPNGDTPVHENTAILAQTSIGQNDVKATPLQMAMVAAAIANDGIIMAPYAVAEVRSADGDAYERYEPSAWRVATSPFAAELLQEAMINVAENGTARNMAIDGLVVGGKTGTAQLGTDPPNSHAWVVGFAGQAGGPAEIAVAVIVEAQPGASEQTGGAVAAPIARAVIEAALS
ncbi:MAG: penicillin-binding transpeptidase domain-containing protein [Acidimicrobiales bacterium]|jgi:peptidoglycan glycosyltransferase|nr:penicillin-binding transpeptidase domain-containing protein [Acidimicrobiales bacterium]